MILTGTITSILSDNSGDGWRRVEYLVNTGGDYAKDVKVSASKDGVINGLKVGYTYDLSIELSAREYQGKYYNDVRVWKYEAK
jgi:hypothetical protein